MKWSAYTCEASMPKTLALNLIKSLYVTSGLQKTGDGKQVKKKKSAKSRMSWDN